jgi:two-component system sensor histidine kinase BaeS
VPDLNGPPLPAAGPEFPPFPTEHRSLPNHPFPEHRAQLLRRIGIFNASGKLLWGNPAAASSDGLVPLYYKSQLIGQMKLQPNEPLMKQLEAPLAVPLGFYLVAGGILGFMSAGIFGWIFASQFERIISALLQGSRRLVSGAGSLPLQASGNDELAEIAQNLNLLFQNSEQQERSHKQWITDTSHELRTPIAILRAQIEAFQDGIQEVNAKTLDVLYSQTMALQKLVDDLHDLAKFDMGELTCLLLPEDLMLLLEEIECSFEERFRARKIDLDCRMLNYESSLLIKADNIRLRQLFANLYENSLRYTNPGGTVRITLEENAASVSVIIDDSPPGIPAEMLARIFDRFFRIDFSRSRALGGTGIGLSISAAIAEAHGGKIEARPSPLGGLQMRVKLLKELSKGAEK